MTTTEDRRAGDRRRSPMALGERGMRCESCGTRWFSAIAALTTQWGRCAACGGQLHAERRSGRDRRRQAQQQVAA
ncbi:MAG TPA: hypothetical protein VFR97_08860 [Capillimicrobium sp.]|nr:hypothetical protein [Capillimicrobium sp.]